jgi:hypothetical protein
MFIPVTPRNWFLPDKLLDAQLVNKLLTSARSWPESCALWIHFSLQRPVQESLTPSEAAARINNILEFSPYRKENTALHRYEDQPVNAV